MGALVLLLANYLTGLLNPGMSRKMNGLIVLICMTAGALIYAALLFIFRIKEATTFLEYLKKRI